VTSAIKEAIQEWVINKTSLSIAVVAVSNVAANTKSQYIDLAATGYGPFTYAGWIALISSAWILTLLIEKWTKWAIELREKIRDRKNKA
jgi:hypothetical protein